MYSRDNKKGKEQSAAFKKAFSQHVNIEFIGVWYVPPVLLCGCRKLICDRDTVSSVGFIPKQLPFTHGDNSIKFFRHALSLDERRVYVPQTSLRCSFPDLQWSGTSNSVLGNVRMRRTSLGSNMIEYLAS